MQNNLQNSTKPDQLKLGTEVLGIVHSFSPLGANIRFNENQQGLLYRQEVYPTLKVGDKLKFYIKLVREDGKIDLTLDQAHYKSFIGDSSSIILNMLKESEGYLPFNDKSKPDDIRDKFHISKKKFKDSIGLLYKKRLIEIEQNGIRLKASKPA